MKIGFTGTREGMTQGQWDAVRALLLELPASEVHHGDCVGADADFDELCAGTFGMADVRIVGHPPDNDALRARCPYVDDWREPKPYLERNRDIVDETEALIAAPKSEAEVTRSGTWSTVRYARERGKMIFLVLPSGEVKVEPGPTRPFSEIKRELETA